MSPDELRSVSDEEIIAFELGQKTFLKKIKQAFLIFILFFCFIFD
jgi:hypothetical protein